MSQVGARKGVRRRRGSLALKYIRDKRIARGQRAPDLDLTRLQELCESPCVYCGLTPAGGIDHMVPIAQGGTDDWDNLAPCCGDCNREKANRTPEEWAAAVERNAALRSAYQSGEGGSHVLARRFSVSPALAYRLARREDRITADQIRQGVSPRCLL